ncbi:MAG TPA: SDR family NAD(P)-dependent oxidoreductase, partial [Actinophytocola sp.]|uniref:SDR family NAD(P)-dependent oxidoreductase n=1 Tax=Actinophytocola sp. TaxID=1872138 RepID=UPI002DBE0A68
TRFLELGPDAILTALTPHCVTEPIVTTPALRPGRDDPHTLLTALATLHTHGTPIDWPAILTPYASQTIDLPTYPFQRQRYWLTATPAPAEASVRTDPAEANFWTAVENQDFATIAETLNLHADNGLATVLPALSAWRRERNTQSIVDEWRYRESWTRIPDPTAVVDGTWLIAVPDGTGDRAPADALRERGAELVEIEIGAAPDRAALTARLRDAVAGSGGIAGVLSLLGGTGLDRTLVLVQALGDAEIDAPLWCVTSGSVSAGASDRLTDLTGAQVWGFGRVVALERPRRWGGLVDLPADLDERAADRFAGILTGKCGEDQLAVRPDGVFARRLVRANAVDALPGNGWRPTGRVLITGGTGALGGHLARWLAVHGATELILVSRSGPAAPGAAELVAELADLGADATVIAADIADRDEVSALLQAHPVTSVVHAAGTTGSTGLTDLTPAELANTLRAKVDGAQHLHELLADTPLHAFILFSSIAGIWGSGGQAAYAAANAHLDALAQHRTNQGQPATAIAWGPWADAGMAIAEEATEYLRRRGLGVLAPELAIRALAQALDAGETRLTVADVDWERFAPAFTSTRPSPLLAELPEARRVLEANERAAAARALDPSGGPDQQGLTQFGERLAAATPTERDRALLELVRTEAAGVLGHDSTAPVSARSQFAELGFDSLTAVDIRNRLAEALGLALPPTLIFDYPTPAALAEYLGTEITAGADAEAGEARIRAALAALPIARFREAGVLDVLLRLAGIDDDRPEDHPVSADPDAIDEMDVDALIQTALDNPDSALGADQHD